MQILPNCDNSTIQTHLLTHNTDRNGTGVLSLLCYKIHRLHTNNYSLAPPSALTLPTITCVTALQCWMESCPSSIWWSSVLNSTCWFCPYPPTAANTPPSITAESGNFILFITTDDPGSAIFRAEDTDVDDSVSTFTCSVSERDGVLSKWLLHKEVPLLIGSGATMEDRVSSRN